MTTASGLAIDESANAIQMVLALFWRKYRVLARPILSAAQAA